MDKPPYYDYIQSCAKTHRYAAEKIAEIEKISGYSLEELKSLFLAGYTLQRPPKSESCKELARMLQRKRRIRPLRKKFANYLEEAMVRNSKLKHPFIIGIARGSLIAGVLCIFLRPFLPYCSSLYGPMLMILGTVMIKTWRE